MSADGRDSVLRFRKEAILRRPQPHNIYECHKSSPPLHPFEPFLNATGLLAGRYLESVLIRPWLRSAYEHTHVHPKGSMFSIKVVKEMGQKGRPLGMTGNWY